MQKYLYLILILSVFTACKKQSDMQIQTTKSPEPKTDSVKRDTAVSQTGSDIHEGVYITNLNAKTFRDCANPDSLYWVADDSKKLEGMYKKMFETPSVYNAVYVKVRGDIEETKNQTTREKYPRTIRVKEVISVEKKNLNNTCVPFDFWAFGNEPGWSVQISGKENLIEFNNPAENKHYFFFYAEPEEADGYVNYTAHNKIQGYIINIRLRKEKCIDKTSGIEHDYSAEVKLTGDKNFKGCAVRGKE